MSTRFATMSVGLNADEVVEVLDNWLPYDKLSNKDIEAILGDALVTKYYNELKEAHIKDPRRVEELVAKVRQKVDEKIFEISDSRVSEAEMKEEEAELEKRKAEKTAMEKENLLILETKQRQSVLNVCLVLGIIFAGIGLIFFAANSLVTGIVLEIAGITFLMLSLGFRHFKIKGGPLEVEANQ